MLKPWPQRIGLLTLVLTLAGCDDMKPPRPYIVPFDVSVAGYVQTINFEVLRDDTDIGLNMLFHFNDRTQQDYLRDKVCDDEPNPNSAIAMNNRRLGLPIPLHVRLTRGETLLLDKVIITTDCFGWSAADQGVIFRGIKTTGLLPKNLYGRGFPKGKFRFDIRNLQAQPVFQGYKLEILIPGDRKV